MLLTYEMDLTSEELDVIFTKVNNVPFEDYDFTFQFDGEDVVDYYLSNDLDNDMLSLLFNYMQYLGKTEPNRTYHTKGMKSVVRTYAKHNKENLFRIQLLCSIFGSCRASYDIACMYLSQERKEEAVSWYKKTLRMGDTEGTVKALMEQVN